MTARIAVIYYSSTGNVHALATALAEGADKQGAEVRLRRVAELAPESVIENQPAWRAHLQATADIPLATLDDLRWADGYAFGSPTRYGNVASQLKQFIDSTNELWSAGELASKPGTGFTSAMNRHGGNESTLLALYHTFHHWGTIIVGPGYTDPLLFAAGGNPYGAAHPSGGGDGPDEATLNAARYQGERLALITQRLLAGATTGTAA